MWFCSHWDWRGIDCSTLPLSAWHLHPSMGPTFVYLERLSRWVRAFTGEISRRHDRFAKYRSLHVSRTLSHLVFLQVASASALLVTFGSLPVITTLSAIRGPSRSGLQLCCASNHCCSSLTTAPSVERSLGLATVQRCQSKANQLSTTSRSCSSQPPYCRNPMLEGMRDLTGCTSS